MYDIVISGGGLVGHSLACALATLPLRIAVIEAVARQIQHTATNYDARVIALNYGSQRILQGIGIWSPLAPHSTPVHTIHVSDQGQFGFSRLYANKVGLPALGYVTPAKALGQVLHAQVQQYNIGYLCPATLNAIHTAADHLELHFDTDEGHTPVQTRLLVAADGTESPARTLMSIHNQEKNYEQTAIIANVTLAKPHQNQAFERFTPSGPIALLPLPNNDCSLVWAVEKYNVKKMLDLSDADFLQALQNNFGWRLGKFIKIGQRSSSALALRELYQTTAKRTVVIGNAAHTLHPIAGQGFNLGLRDVASLADVIADAVNANHDIGCATVLKQYAQQQQADQWRVTRITDGLVELFSNRVTSLSVLRNLGLLALDALPPLKHQFAQQMTGLNTFPSRLIRGLPIVPSLAK